MTEPINLYVGTSANGDDAEAEMALEWSVHRNTKRKVKIHWMSPTTDPYSLWHDWNMTRWATPFSGFRWSVPEANGFKGRAIYADNDVLFLGDIEELLNTPIEDGHVLAYRGMGRFCVTVFDCEAAAEVFHDVQDMKLDEKFHGKMAYNIEHRDLGSKFDPSWNILDGETRALSDIKGLHFTDMSTNPAFAISRWRLSTKDWQDRWPGRTHWYDGPIRTHRRQDVVDCFNRYYREALGNGWDILGYIPFDEPLMEYRKANLDGWRSRAVL